jgi:hypothetical protein
MWIRNLAAAALALSGPAVAAQADKDALAKMGITIVEPMSAEQVAATRERVRAEIERSSAGAWFEDATDTSGGKARHRPSGLHCALGGKGQRIVAASAEAATCETANGNALYRIDVVRAPPGATLASVVAAARASVEREPGYAPQTGPTIVAHPKPGSGLPDHETLRFSSKVVGDERMSRVQVGLVRGWILTNRRITPKAKAAPFSMGEMMSEATFGIEMKP